MLTDAKNDTYHVSLGTIGSDSFPDVPWLWWPWQFWAYCSYVLLDAPLWGLVWCFSWLDWSYGISGRRTTEVKCPSYHVVLTFQHDLAGFLLTWVTRPRQWWPGFSTVKLLFSHPSPSSTPWKEVALWAFHEGWGVRLPSLWVEYWHKLFAVFLPGRLLSSSSLTYISIDSWVGDIQRCAVRHLAQALRPSATCCLVRLISLCQAKVSECC